MKKALMYAHVASMIQLFNMDNIRILIQQGYQVDVACNMEEGSSISDEKIAAMREELEAMGCHVFHVPVPRRLKAVRALWDSLRTTKRLMDEQAYDLVHCHSPIGGVICRVANRLSKNYRHTKMLYTAHGFHFYKGAPRKNWLAYYPAERLCAHLTDGLITINQEDYALASRKFHLKKDGQVLYVPGVGIDLNKFAHREVTDRSYLQSLGLDIRESDTVLLSVGELIVRKNHELVIRALARLDRDDVKYLICGMGAFRPELEKLIDQYNLRSRVFLLGYRTDIAELLNASDAYVFPSFQEGLSVALMEAMAVGKTVACSRIRGNVDLIDRDGGVMFDPYSVDDCLAALKVLLRSDRAAMGAHNAEAVRRFSKDYINDQMARLYESLMAQPSRENAPAFVYRAEDERPAAKKALMYAHVASMIQLFNMDNIRMLIERGYQVDVACNMEEGSSISKEKIELMREELVGMGCRVIHVPVPRRLKAVRALWASLRQTKALMRDEVYDLVHCHSPIGGVICRAANRMAGHYGHTRMIYTAHGFHFYKGAPRKNWLIYYPAERLCAHLTDDLITINREDYALASQKFRVKKGGQILYIPGVGVETKRFAGAVRNHDALCDWLDIPRDSILMLSVGELNDNKNHQLVVKALAALDERVHYVICGQGPNDKWLRPLAEKMGCAEHVHLLGYCMDVSKIIVSCDLFAFPSLREGLSLALMEAMASALPAACSRIRGNVELIDENGGAFFDPRSVESCTAALKQLLQADRRAMGAYNAQKVQSFSKDTVNEIMARIYEK